MLGGGAEFSIVGVEKQSSLVKALTNRSFKISTWSCSRFRNVDAIYVQWGYTRAIALHILYVDKEILVVRDLRIAF